MSLDNNLKVWQSFKWNLTNVVKKISQFYQQFFDLLGKPIIKLLTLFTKYFWPKKIINLWYFVYDFIWMKNVLGYLAYK